MKRIVLSDLRKFSVINAPVPEVSGDFDVQIKISSVGICGSDIHYFRTGRIGDQVISYPFTPGHECTGIVVKTGAKVSQIHPGDRIVIEPAISCGTCDQCLAARPHTCRQLKFLGNPSEMEGALQEYIVLPEKSCFKLPDNVSLTDGIIVEPLTIALYAAGFNCGRKDLAILGFGPIGICTFKALKWQYPDANMFVTDKIAARVDHANMLGAHWSGNPLEADIAGEMLKSNPSGMDTVIECCGQQEAITQAVELLRPGGQLIVIGIPEEDAMVFNAHQIRRKEIMIHNVRRQNNQYPHALDLLGSRQIDFGGFISHTFQPGQIQEAFELVEAYHDGVIKAVIEFE